MGNCSELNDPCCLEHTASKVKSYLTIQTTKNKYQGGLIQETLSLLTPNQHKDANRNHWDAQPLSHAKPTPKETQKGIGLSKIFCSKSKCSVSHQEYSRNRSNRSLFFGKEPKDNKQE